MKQEAEEFIKIYNEIDKEIKRITNVKKHENFTKALRKGEKSYSSIRYYKEELKVINNLRNHIVHNNKYIAEPNQKSLKLIKKVKNKIINPPKVEKMKCNVVTINKNESLLKAIKLMKQKSYSQLPITDAEKVIDLLTDNAIARWLGKQDNKQGGILIENDQKISEVFKYKEEECYFDFISRNEKLYDVIEIYNKVVNEGKIFDALLITQNGEISEKILGIITSWDIPRIYEMI